MRVKSVMRKEEQSAEKSAVAPAANRVNRSIEESLPAKDVKKKKKKMQRCSYIFK